jgi:hypothetical protein
MGNKYLRCPNLNQNADSRGLKVFAGDSFSLKELNRKYFTAIS